MEISIVRIPYPIQSNPSIHLYVAYGATSVTRCYIRLGRCNFSPSKMANDDDKFGTSIIGVNVVTGTNLPSSNPIILVRD